jgi:hypothetical protein
VLAGRLGGQRDRGGIEICAAVQRYGRMGDEDLDHERDGVERTLLEKLVWFGFGLLFSNSSRVVVLFNSGGINALLPILTFCAACCIRLSFS